MSDSRTNPEPDESDLDEFRQYLDGCTDAQVIGVIEKEKAAGRKSYLRLAEQYARNRNIL